MSVVAARGARAVDPVDVDLDWLGPAYEGSIVIPAHDEAAVIGRALDGFSRLVREGRLEVVVVCNGCTDATAEIARRYAGVTVLEIETASKVAALNAGDEVARCWPRLYLDADVELSTDSLRELFHVLRHGAGVQAVRPTIRYDTTGASALVRSYYRARSRSSAQTRALWGAGAYALSHAGRVSFDRFPDVTSDDLFVDRQFAAGAKDVVGSATSVVRTPRDLDGLLAVLRRTYRGNREVAGGDLEGLEPGGRSTSTVASLLGSTRRLTDLGDTAVYLAASVLGRVLAARAGARPGAWERDDSSRRVLPPTVPIRGGSCDHVLLTRFNLPSRGVESLVRAQDGWLADRVALFERYCAPAVRVQSVQDFSWIVYLDPASPGWLLERLEPHVRAGLFTPVFREEVSREELLDDIARVVGPSRREALITTNLDNDDGLAVDFVERLQALPVGHGRAALYLGRGLIRQGRSVYLRTDRRNAFCSVRESWDEPVTCWADWHNRLGLQMPVVEAGGPPAWLQVVHGTNVSNRVRGRLTSARRHRRTFGDLIADVDDVGPGPLLRDWVTQGPRRVARDVVRTGAKRLIVLAAGPQGLDRIKLLHARRRS